MDTVIASMYSNFQIYWAIIEEYKSNNNVTTVFTNTTTLTTSFKETEVFFVVHLDDELKKLLQV